MIKMPCGRETSVSSYLGLSYLARRYRRFPGGCHHCRRLSPRVEVRCGAAKRGGPPHHILLRDIGNLTLWLLFPMEIYIYIYIYIKQ